MTSDSLNRSSRGVRLLLAGMSPLFFIAASLQFNDAEALQWIVIYGMAALLCGVSALGYNLPWWVGSSAACASLLYAGYLGWCIASGEATPMHSVRPPPPSSPKSDSSLFALEEGREMGGLLIIAATLLLQSFWQRSRQSEDASHP